MGAHGSGARLLQFDGCFGHGGVLVQLGLALPWNWAVLLWWLCHLGTCGGRIAAGTYKYHIFGKQVMVLVQQIGIPHFL